MKCKDHPKYKAIKPPRCACEACWWMYFYINNYMDYEVVKTPVRLVRKDDE